MSSRALALPRSGKESADPAMRSARKRVRSPEPGFGRIRAGILSLSVLIMALTGVVVAYSSVAEKRHRIADTQRDALTMARAVDQQLTNIVQRKASLVGEIQASIAAEGGMHGLAPSRLAAILRVQRYFGPEVRGLALIGPDGVVRASVGEPGALPASGESCDCFRRHLGDPRPGLALSAAVVGLGGKIVVPVTGRINGPDGEFDGVVVVSLDAERLLAYFRSLGVPHEGAIALLTPEADFLLRHPSASHPPDPALARIVVDELRGPEGPIRSLSPVDGTKRLGAYRRIGEMPLYAVVTVQEARLLGAWERNTLLRGAGGLGVMSITAVFTWLLLRRLHAERAAAMNLSKFRRAVDLSGDLVYWLARDGRVVYVNDSAARRLGLEPGDRPQLHIRDFSRRYTPGQWDMLWGVLATEREFRYQTEHVAADGSAYPVEIAATYLEMDGQACGFFVARDLTAQRQQEARIRDLNASLERRVEERTRELAAANAELEAFSHSISHDLRAPVNQLEGYANALAHCLDDDSRRQTFVRKIGERARHMNELIDALLGLSRIAATPLARRDVDLSALAREIDADLRRESPGRTVETMIQPGLRASADPVLARTLLQNVIGNAWKYSSKLQEARIEVFSEHGEDGIQFAVRDNGAGFDPAYAAKLFGPFQRLHSQSEFKGNGIGLATVRRIVARHGGRIWAESAPGRGAAFRFTLP